MFCTRCGVELDDKVRYCSSCGAATHNAQSSHRSGAGRGEPLTRPQQDKKIAGVCAGVARYFGTDVTLVRILWLTLAVLPPGAGLIAYVVCWIVMPTDPLPAAASSGASPSPSHVSSF